MKRKPKASNKSVETTKRTQAKVYILNKMHLKPRPLLFVLLFTVIGTLLLFWTKAATPTPTIEPENSTLSGNASKVTNVPGLSGGSALQFGTTASLPPGAIPPAPSPSPTPSGRKDIGLMGAINQADIDTLSYMHFNTGRGEIGWYGGTQMGTGIGNRPWTVDGLINALASRNARLLPLFNNYDVLSTRYGNQGPKDFATALVNWSKKYAKGGTFWAGRTDYGCEWVEIFNEYWGTWWNRGNSIEPELYARYLIESRNALNAAGLQHVKILHSSPGDEFLSFDNRVAAAGGIAASDGISVHPYGTYPGNGTLSSGEQSWDKVNYLHAKYPTKPIYPTEFGYHRSMGAARNTIIQQIIQEVVNTSWIPGAHFYEFYDGDADWGWTDQGIRDAARTKMISLGY